MLLFVALWIITWRVPSGFNLGRFEATAIEGHLIVGRQWWADEKFRLSPAGRVVESFDWRLPYLVSFHREVRDSGRDVKVISMRETQIAVSVWGVFLIFAGLTLVSAFVLTVTRPELSRRVRGFEVQPPR